MTFDNFYRAYPRHIERRDAEKAWQQLMRKGTDPKTIHAVLEERIEKDWRGRKKEYIPYPATFLRAEDFDDEVEAREDDPLPPLFASLMMHWCPVCQPGHEHACTNPAQCTAGRELACDRVLVRLKKANA